MWGYIHFQNAMYINYNIIVVNKRVFYTPFSFKSGGTKRGWRRNAPANAHTLHILHLT